MMGLSALAAEAQRVTPTRLTASAAPWKARIGFSFESSVTRKRSPSDAYGSRPCARRSRHSARSVRLPLPYARWRFKTVYSRQGESLQRREVFYERLTGKRSSDHESGRPPISAPGDPSLRTVRGAGGWGCPTAPAHPPRRVAAGAPGAAGGASGRAGLARRDL